jgi:hypothetical protein
LAVSGYGPKVWIGLPARAGTVGVICGASLRARRLRTVGMPPRRSVLPGRGLPARARTVGARRCADPCVARLARASEDGWKGCRKTRSRSPGLTRAGGGDWRTMTVVALNIATYPRGRGRLESDEAIGRMMFGLPARAGTVGWRGVSFRMSTIGLRRGRVCHHPQAYPRRRGTVGKKEYKPALPSEAYPRGRGTIGYSTP